jgi:hypothetical protein
MHVRLIASTASLRMNTPWEEAATPPKRVPPCLAGGRDRATRVMTTVDSVDGRRVRPRPCGHRPLRPGQLKTYRRPVGGNDGGDGAPTKRGSTYVRLVRVPPTKRTPRSRGAERGGAPRWWDNRARGTVPRRACAPEPLKVARSSTGGREAIRPIDASLTLPDRVNVGAVARTCGGFAVTSLRGAATTVGG